MTRVKRRRQEIHTAIVVKGGGPDKQAPSIGAAIAIALTRAAKLDVGAAVRVIEYEDVIGRAISTEAGAVWV